MTRTAVLAFFALAGTVAAQEPIRIGVLNDQSSVYADFQGKGSVLAAQMAVEDYGGKAAGRKAEEVFADQQNKPETGSVLAGKWVDHARVALILDDPNSALAPGEQE